MYLVVEDRPKRKDGIMGTPGSVRSLSETGKLLAFL